MTRNIRTAFAIVLGLSLMPVSGWSAFAEDPAPGQTAPGEVKAGDFKRGEHREWCKANPQECKERREWCEKNPGKCPKPDGDSKGGPNVPDQAPTP